nr:hypothetical protein [Paenibacillus ihbetae]
MGYFRIASAKNHCERFDQWIRRCLPNVLVETMETGTHPPPRAPGTGCARVGSVQVGQLP